MGKVKTLEVPADESNEGAELRTWITDNFRVIGDYGGHRIHRDLEYDAGDVEKAKDFFKKHAAKVQTLQHPGYLYKAMAIFIQTLKEHIQLLESGEKNNRAEDILTLREIIINGKKVSHIAFNIDKQLHKITDPGMIDLIINAICLKFPGMGDAQAQLISDKLRIVNRENKGIPDFVYRVSYLTDITLKKIMPGITTLQIIRDLLWEIDLHNYADVSRISKYIQRGKEAKNR